MKDILESNTRVGKALHTTLTPFTSGTITSLVLGATAEIAGLCATLFLIFRGINRVMQLQLCASTCLTTDLPCCFTQAKAWTLFALSSLAVWFWVKISCSLRRDKLLYVSLFNAMLMICAAIAWLYSELDWLSFFLIEVSIFLLCFQGYKSSLRIKRHKALN